MKALLRPRTVWSMLLAGGSIAACALPAVAQVTPKVGTTNPENVITIFMPAPRALRQQLSRAQAAIAEERYADAVEALGGILSGETGDPELKSNKGELTDDFFLPIVNPGDPQTSLKTQALQMLGAMPEKGRRLYEINFGADARAMLDTALAEGNIPKLTEVARRYFHTKAGYEAAILLGRLNLDQGRPLAAALAFKRVADVPTAAAQYDPELSLLLATSWQFAGQQDKAKETLVALRQRNPGAKIAAGNKPVVLFERDGDALDWLTKLVGSGGKARTAEALQWVMFRGNETRTATTNASLPLLSPRWTVPAVDDPQDAIRIRQQAKTPADRILIPSLQPLVVKDYVIYRTADRVLGASLTDQGKRVWYFPWDESAFEKAARTSATQPRSPISSTREQQLDVRIWRDHPYGEMSSDGNQVFLIDEIGFPAIFNNNQMQQRIFMGARGGMFANPFNQQTTNKLAAIDLNRQGALNWKIGGESGEDDPNLAGAFFLGPPLPLAGQLFSLAEFNGEVRLLCLNAKTGMLEWKQSLAMMPEGRTITLDSVRRLAGATPSFAEGVLVCPTSGEGVAAVDLATRTLRWGYQYPRLDAGRFPGFNRGFQMPVNDGAGKEHWIDGSVTISGGTVLLTPVESMDLHCLDLLTGKPKWKSLPCEEMLFLGCVHDGKAILVGKRQLKAINIADGKEAWAASIDLEGDAPSGRGYYSDRFYYLPTSSAHILKIELDKGSIAAQMKTGNTLGNLVCYKDELISQTPEGISSFYLAEPLRKRTEELLVKNPNDPWALARKGEILLQDGKQEEALQTLRRALVLSPEDAETKGMLARAMLSLLRADFAAHQELAAEAEPLLADQPVLRREFYRLRAQAMEKAGSPREAFAAYIALRDQPGDTAELEELSREHSVRRERWISARLAILFNKANPQVKKQLEEQVQARLMKAKEASGTAILADFVDFFRFHPLAAEGQLELAQRYMQVDKLIEAELAIGELATHSEPTISGRAHALLAATYEAAGRFELARERYETLAEKYSAVVCLPGKTGKDLANEAALRQTIQLKIASRTWPSGNVEAKLAELQGGSVNFGSNYRFVVPISEFRGAAPRGQRGQISPSEFRAFDSAGKLVSTTSLLRAGNGQQVIPSNQSTGKLVGHLTLVLSGGEIVAVDALRVRPGITTEGLLWRNDTTDGDPNMRGRIGYSTRPPFSNPLLPSSYRNSIQVDRGQGAIGAVSSLGVTYLHGRQLVCVEALSGKVLWERTGIETGSDVFGDEHKIVVIAPGEKSDQALVYGAIDGSLLDRRMVDRQDHRWATCGRNVLAWEAGDGKLVHLRLYDATNQGAGLWSKDVIQPAKGFIIDGEELALLEPSGKFTVVSLKTGKELISASVDPEPELQSIAVVASRGQYLLCTKQPETGEASGITALPLQNVGPAGFPVHGKVYAFDRATGAPQWQTPAFVSQHALPPDQPTESPLLVFARRKTVSRGGGATSNVSSLLCLDRRDGSVIYEEDAIVGMATNCDTTCDRESRTVLIHVTGNDGSRTVTLKFTDNPAPPRPPAQLGIMSSRTLGERPGTVVDVATDIFRALNQGPLDGNPNGARPPPIRLRLPGGLPVPQPR